MFNINESWVDDIVKQAQQQVIATSKSDKSSNPTTSRRRRKKSKSLSKKKLQQQQQSEAWGFEAWGAFPEQSITILPESLSINRRDPTCWQITLHRMSKTKGEF